MLALFLPAISAALLSSESQSFISRVNVGEYVNISLSSSASQAVVLWHSQSSTPNVAVNATFPNHTAAGIWNHGVRLAGRGAVLSFDRSVALQRWVIPDSLCPGPLAVYLSPSSVHDILVPSPPVDRLCLFFMNSDQLSLRIDSQFDVAFYQLSDVTTPWRSCEKNKICERDFAERGFAVVSDIKGRGSVVITADAANDGVVRCARDFLPIFRDGKLTAPKVGTGATLSCGDANRWGGLPIALAGVLTIVAGTLLLVCCRWCSRLKLRLQLALTGVRDVNAEIDPAKLLRQDQISELVQVIPEDEEEEEQA
jgi:hypothetical protein